LATILAVQMMLEWLGERRSDERLALAAARVETAVGGLLVEGRMLTEDLGGSATTRQVGDAVARRLEKGRGVRR
jgi:isocitrate/isopropylmalate dehydrogenase